MRARDIPDVGRANVGHAKLKHARGEREPALRAAHIAQLLQRQQHASRGWTRQPAGRCHLAQRHDWPVGFKRPDDIQAARQRLNEVGSCLASHRLSFWHNSAIAGIVCWYTQALFSAFMVAETSLYCPVLCPCATGLCNSSSTVIFLT